MQRMHWSYEQLMVCPVLYMEVLIDLLNEDDRRAEADRARARSRRR